MIFRGKSLEEIGKTDLERLVKDNLEESQLVEYKYAKVNILFNSEIKAFDVL